jgi:quinol-cytochrome oxidoreductase complex cytochrome b subunit
MTIQTAINKLASLFIHGYKLKKMRKLFLLFAIVCVAVLNSCSAIEGIFKAGFWTGLIFVIVIAAAVVFVLANIFKKKS